MLAEMCKSNFLSLLSDLVENVYFLPIVMRFGFKIPCILICLCHLLVVGCASSGESEVIALIDNLAPEVYYEKGEGNNLGDGVVLLGLNIDTHNESRKRKILEILPKLSQLPFLEVLKISGKALSDEDLRSMPQDLHLSEIHINSVGLTDECLQYFSSFKGLKKLSIYNARIYGAGFSYLKNASDLEWLYVLSAPIDDRAIPHIVTNFKKLKRIDLAKAAITPDGMLQLARLHWLTNINFPDNLIVHDSEDRLNDSSELQTGYRDIRAFHLEYAKAHLRSKLRAKEAGMEAPPFWQYPFGPLPEIEELIRKKQLVTKNQDKPSHNKGWTNYPAKENSIQDE